MLPVRFPASGRGSWKSPLSAVPAGLFHSIWSQTATLSTLSSIALAVTAQLLGQERFNAVRFSAAFMTAAVIDLLFAGRATTSHPKGTRS
jgi:hypothetical protein